MATRKICGLFVAITGAAAAIVSCTGTSTVGNPQAKFIPTARNDWRVQCMDGYVIPHFLGSYGEAVQAPDCANRGGVRRVWDNGLAAFGLAPNPFFITIRTNIIDDDAGGPGRIRPEWASASCAVATCADSARNQYDVTYLDRRTENRSRFSCPAAGLLNGRRGGADVVASPREAAPQNCPVGVTVRQRRR